MLVGIMLVGGLGVSHGSGILAPQLVVLWIECTRADPTPDPQPQSEHLESVAAAAALRPTHTKASCARVRCVGAL